MCLSVVSTGLRWYFFCSVYHKGSYIKRNKGKSWHLWKYLQCSEIIWLIKKKIQSLANVSFFAVWLAAAGLSTPSPPCSSRRSDSFEGQSQWEWDGPSDEHWLPSTSVGCHCLCRLITLQSSTGALRAVNYFGEQCGDVPSCERERELETETQRLSRNQWELEWKRDEAQKKRSERVWEKWIWEGDKKWETLRKERGLGGVSERPASHNVASDSLYSRRQASTNEQSYKLITYQAERGRWERERWRDGGGKG